MITMITTPNYFFVNFVLSFLCWLPIKMLKPGQVGEGWDRSKEESQTDSQPPIGHPKLGFLTLSATLAN